MDTINSRPTHLKVREQANLFEVKWRWLRGVHFFLVFVCLFWFSILWALVASSSLFLLIGLVHIGIGLFLAYFTLCGFVNKTTITLRYKEVPSADTLRQNPQRTGSLTISHGPLPYRAGVSLLINEIEQLFCCEEIHQSNKKGEPTYVTYQLIARFPKNEMKILLRELPTLEMAAYLEEKLERLLGIENQNVPGEVA